MAACAVVRERLAPLRDGAGIAAPSVAVAVKTGATPEAGGLAWQIVDALPGITPPGHSLRIFGGNDYGAPAGTGGMRKLGAAFRSMIRVTDTAQPGEIAVVPGMGTGIPTGAAGRGQTVAFVAIGISLKQWRAPLEGFPFEMTVDVAACSQNRFRSLRKRRRAVFVKGLGRRRGVVDVGAKTDQTIPVGRLIAAAAWVALGAIGRAAVRRQM